MSCSPQYVISGKENNHRKKNNDNVRTEELIQFCRRKNSLEFKRGSFGQFGCLLQLSQVNVLANFLSLVMQVARVLFILRNFL